MSTTNVNPGGYVAAAADVGGSNGHSLCVSAVRLCGIAAVFVSDPVQQSHRF